MIRRLVLVAATGAALLSVAAHADKPAPAPTTTAPRTPARVTTYTFGGLDVEGRLRAPQLLFFFHRMQTEFDASRTPHRSFLPELLRTADAAP